MADRLHLEWDGNPEVVPVLEWDLAELSDSSPGDEGFCEPCWASLVEGLPDGWLENVDGVEVMVNEGGESPDSGGGSGAELGDAVGVFEMDHEEGNGAEEENENENENEDEDFSSVAAEVLSELADVVFEDEPVLPSPFVLDCPEVPGVNCRSCDYHRFQTKDPNMKCSLCYMRMHAFAVYGECFLGFVTCMKRRCFCAIFSFLCYFVLQNLFLPHLTGRGPQDLASRQSARGSTALSHAMTNPWTCL